MVQKGQFIDGARYVVIERCVQCSNNVQDESQHKCLMIHPAKDTGLCSDPIPDWCPLPLLEHEVKVIYHVRVGEPGELIRKKVLDEIGLEVRRWLNRGDYLMTPHDVRITSFNTVTGEVNEIEMCEFRPPEPAPVPKPKRRWKWRK